MRLKHIALAVLSATFLAGLAVSPSAAADKIQLKFTTVSVPTDWHTKAMKVFKDTLDNLEPGVFDIQLYDSGSLFGQGADLDAVQRGNAEMAYVSFQQIADAIPEFSLMTSGYLFQSPDHFRVFFNSGIGQQFKQKVSDEMGIHLLDICYLGTREIDLRTVHDVKTPADLAGIKLRMPGSDAWLFLGKALGVNPTPLPFGEVYLGLQTGTIDGAGQPAADGLCSQVLRGHQADHHDRSSGRCRHAGGRQPGVEQAHGRREGRHDGGGNRGLRLQQCGAHSRRAPAARLLQIEGTDDHDPRQGGVP